METSGIILIIFLSGATFNVFSLPAEKKDTVSAKFEPVNDITDLINQTIEAEIRPLLDETFVIDGSIPLHFDNLFDLLNGDLTLEDISITGLNGFLIPYLDERGLIPLTLKLMLVIPKLQVDTGYDTNISVADSVNIFGKGQVSILLENLQITGTSDINVLDSPIQLTNTRVEIEVEAVDIGITGLFDNDDLSAAAGPLITQLANDVIVSYLNSNVQEVSDVISPPIQDLLNQIIADLLGGGDTKDLSSTKQKFAKVTEQFFNILKQNSA